MGADRKLRAALCGNEALHLGRVYGRGRKTRLEGLTNLHPRVVDKAALREAASDFEDVEVLFSTWGMDRELAESTSRLPNLKAFFYAAGTVQHFAAPLLDKGIVLVSAWAANAVPVAQFTLAQVLLALKGYFRNSQAMRRAENRGKHLEAAAAGILGEMVSLLGCGMVGRKTAALLRPFELELLVYDPFLPESEARALGLRLVSLEEAFAEGLVVSNHLADLPATRGLLHGGLFASMRPGATFINTGRGATVKEEEMVDVLRHRPDLTALLDVTSPEPPAPDSRLYGLENAHLSSHIAGSQGDEVVRMADYCLEEFEAWKDGRPLRYQVTPAMLERMA